MKTIHFLLFSLSCLALFPGCQDDSITIAPYVVSGVITDQLGNPVPDVLVNSVVDTVTTDASGIYSVTAYPGGAIEFTKNGYEKQIISVDNLHEINVSLYKLPQGTETKYEIFNDLKQCQDGSTVNVTFVHVRDFGEGTGNITWTKDKVWVLKNKVFVNEGQTLTIEPGTIVQGGIGEADASCLLAVARGGKIIANGTAEEPIIFTSETDDLLRNGDGSICRETNLTKADKGLWGGVVLLGKAILNNASGEAQIEGISGAEPRAVFGGHRDDDDSGVLRYVSIRHAGTNITTEKEVNALLMGGVGSGTVIEYVEAFACDDDGFEIYGGKVNTRYLVAAFSGDDSFDYNQGWRGFNQFWFSYASADADRGGEHDGGTDPITGTPFSNPIIFNATYVGSGGNAGKRAVSFRANAAGEYHQSLLLNYAYGVDLEFTGTDQQDCFRNLQNGYLVFQNNILSDLANSPAFYVENKSPLPNNDPAVLFTVNYLADYFVDNGNIVAPPGLDDEFVPGAGTPAAQGGSEIPNVFFMETNYRGCFEPDKPRWIEGWTRAAKEL